jgi:membrane-bound metal-dependent hydrolase YbcI (DUF457 family)
VDLFTHVLVAYLLTFGLVGFQPSYLAAGALAGGLPDGDIFLLPLWRRFPILRHHGITHSIFGVTIVAVVGGAVIAPHLSPGNPWIYFAVMEAGGLAHILMDGFTNFSVPPLLPFSARKLEIDADRAVNFVTMLVSVASFYLLLGVERNHVAFWIYLDTVYALMAFFVAYFAIRLAGRWLVQAPLREMGPGSVPVPATDPFSWVLLREERSPGRVTTTYTQYRLGRGIVKGPYRISVPTETSDGASGPVGSPEEALTRSYPIARHHSGLLDDTYHFGEIERSGAGAWSVVWFSLEYSMFGRSAATRVTIAADGAMTAHRAWYRPRIATLPM